MEIDYDKVGKAEAAIDSVGLNAAEKIALIESLLDGSFSWANSPQGAEYWVKVADAIQTVMETYTGVTNP